MWLGRTLMRLVEVVGGGARVGVVVLEVRDNWRRLHSSNLITILPGESDVLPKLDLTNSISDS